MKNPFKRKKDAGIPTQAVPRTAEEIKKLYFELRARAGEMQYQASVYSDEVKRVNDAMRELNYEMDARNKLDAAAATQAKPEATQGAANVQS